MASVVYGAVMGFFDRRFRKSSLGRPHWAPIYVLMLSWALYGARNSPINLPRLILAMYLIVYGVACDSVYAKTHVVPVVPANFLNAQVRSIR
jgi:hypothetical protein